MRNGTRICFTVISYCDRPARQENMRCGISFRCVLSSFVKLILGWWIHVTVSLKVLSYLMVLATTCLLSCSSADFLPRCAWTQDLPPSFTLSINTNNHPEMYWKTTGYPVLRLAATLQLKGVALLEPPFPTVETMPSEFCSFAASTGKQVKTKSDTFWSVWSRVLASKAW